jgi:hypothetical protein
VLIHYSEESVDTELRRTQTFCKECDAYAWVRLVERARTVSLYWVIRQTERNHFLICGACQAQFRLKPHNKDDIEQADIHTLLGMSGGRHVPFMTRVAVFLAVITVWMPVANLLFVWVAWKERAVLPPDWVKWLKNLFWVALAVNGALVLSLVLDNYFGARPEY